MVVKVFHIDAFTDVAFAGGPALVFIVEMSDELPTELGLKAAREYQQPVTTFLQGSADNTQVRFFSHTQELGLVGHAGLAASYVAHKYLGDSGDTLILNSPVGGAMRTRRDGDLLAIDLPSLAHWSIDPESLQDKLQVPVVDSFESDFGPLAILQTERQVVDFSPNYSRLQSLPGTLTITSRGDTVDFVSRVFPARPEFPEDPVCGTAHRVLVPYWSRILGKREEMMEATQVSWRKGTFYCYDQGDSVRLAGRCVEVMSGTARLL